MAFDKNLVAEALKRVTDPHTGRDFSAEIAGRIQHIAACDGHAVLKLGARDLESSTMKAWGAGVFEALSRVCQTAGEPLLALSVEFVDERGQPLHLFRFGQGGPTPRPSPPENMKPPASNPAQPGHSPIQGLRSPDQGTPLPPLPNVKHIIAVGAGKGGVGKSSIAVNLAVGLARRGHAVGLMDGDIYGPSLPTMLGLHELEQVVLAGKLQPFLVHGVKAITIGKLVDPDRPLIWRGPMAHGAFKQLVEQTEWGPLDYLIIDLPPGTGDVSLTMAQMLQLTGAVIVCTPQRVAQDDAIRAVRMFQQLGIDLLGIVENMSSFIGDDGREYDIFGKGGAEKMAARLNLPFLGAVPITMALRENSDRGDPSANFKPGPLAASLEHLVEAMARQAALASMRQGQHKPTLKVT